MPDNPVTGMASAVREHFDAAVGTHVRNVTGAAEMGGKILDAGKDAVSKVKSWWDDDGRGNRKRRHGDVRLPNEGRRRNRGRSR